MKDLRKNEFIDMLQIAEILYEESDKFIKCDIPTLGAVTYFPKANKLQIDKVNKWEENGFEFVKRILNNTVRILNNTVKANSYVEINPYKSVVKIREVKSDEELRDEFAGLAMLGLISSSNNRPTPDYAAEQSYRYADAMMKQRKI